VAAAWLERSGSDSAGDSDGGEEEDDGFIL
jgi:hypothetical protein